MAIRLGDKAPDFTQKSSAGEINFYEFLGDSWGALLSHPADYTPVCTTELAMVAKLKSEFEKRNTKVIALSVDTLESHEGWIKDINETLGVVIDYPIIADADYKVSNLFGMIHPGSSETMTVRSVFIIDPEKIVRLIITYPASTGRNFEEILRVIDSLQLTAKYSVATPANWKQGDDCVISPSIQDYKELEEKFPKGFKIIRPYLRITPQPDL